MSTGPSGSDPSTSLRRAAERAPRRTGARAAIFLGLAAFLALGTAALFTEYLEARTAAARVPTTPVVVAAIDLPAATTLRAEALTTVAWPATSLPGGAASDPAALVGRVVTGGVAKGEPVLEARLAAPGAGSGLAAVLKPGMRAVAVRVDDVVGVAGFIHPGDSVDVIVTMKPTEGSNQPPVSKIVLQNVRVLSVGKELDRADRKLDKAIPATVATLMVDSADSERLALAAIKGQLLLSLRSGVDDDVVDTDGITPPVLLAGTAPPPPAKVVTTGSGPSRRAAVRPKPAPAASAPPPERQVVEILRGDLFERRDFAKGAGR